MAPAFLTTCWLASSILFIAEMNRETGPLRASAVVFSIARRAVLLYHGKITGREFISRLKGAGA